MSVTRSYPLPANPTTGQQPLTTLGSRGVGGAPPASAAGGGGVNRETLKGLQDVIWSDDEDDPDCILCAEPLDLSDLNFKPCQCGMQICQFCYNKLLSTDPRCPGCRRAYDAKSVVFQPVDWEEVKRAKEKKTRRAKTIKQLDGIGRRHLLGVRVVMKNTVYVVGMKLPAPGDESIPILRSNDYFGQYGKISKLYLRDRTTVSSTSVHTLSPDNPATSTGIYIVYIRREDAARAISALDGIPAPQGPSGQTLKASYGTTRYCEAFLRGSKCDISNCHNLHEWGGESDCFTKDDMETALSRPAEYDARQKQATITIPSLSSKAAWPKPTSADEPVGSTGLPSSANWGKTIGSGRTPRTTSTSTTRPAKVSTLVPLTKNTAAFPLPTPSPIPITIVKEKRKGTAMSRGKSSDSATTSSNQASPKKKSSNLPSTVVTASTSTPVEPAPPVVPEQAPSLEDADPESTSAESEAGPSSISPPPQTPGKSDLPPPLTSDPIFLHSPYEEPSLSHFPASDPAFAFYLGLDEREVAEHYQLAGYQPSPFSKTLLGLAELGVLAPEVPELQPLGNYSFTGSFQPFDTNLDTVLESSDITDQQSNQQPEEQDGPRTTSRFDFARPTSRSASSRNQSPFTMRRIDDNRGGWHGHDYGESSNLRRGSVNHLGSGASGYEGGEMWSGVVDTGYNNHNNNNNASPSLQRGEREARYMSKSRNEDDYDSSYGFAQNPQQHQTSRSRTAFSEEESAYHANSGFGYFNSQQPPLQQQQHHHHQQQQQHHPQQQQQQQQSQRFPDARGLQQHVHQLRSGSPTHMGYRRY